MTNDKDFNERLTILAHKTVPFLPDTVRKKCPCCNGTGKAPHISGCWECGDTGWVVNSAMQDWITAAVGLGYEVVFNRNVCYLCPAGSWRMITGKDADPFHALVKAIEEFVAQKYGEM